jgi:hypothetical protein
VKRGRPPALPIESPHWISYAAALRDAVNRYGSERLAIEKLGGALGSGSIRCKIERIDAKPELIKRGARVAMIYQPEGEYDEWYENPYPSINDGARQGLLFLWNLDRLIYFGDAVEEAAAKPVEMQETAAAKGRLLRYDWVEIALFADFLRRNSRGITRNHVVHKLQQRLAEQGVEVPGDTELQAVVKQVFDFAERHPQKPR